MIENTLWISQMTSNIINNQFGHNILNCNWKWY